MASYSKTSTGPSCLSKALIYCILLPWERPFLNVHFHFKMLWLWICWEYSFSFPDWGFSVLEAELGPCSRDLYFSTAYARHQSLNPCRFGLTLLNLEVRTGVPPPGDIFTPQWEVCHSNWETGETDCGILISQRLCQVFLSMLIQDFMTNLILLLK